ncbi:MAG: hypothetical protein SGI87_10795 [Flavobacteriales bacterium]|nr:hypothetical protein [Flavobacteriales bacterium]
MNAKNINKIQALISSNDRYALQVYLKELTKSEIQLYKHLPVYHDLLLFILAYPTDAPEINLAEKLLRKISAFLKKNVHSLPYSLINSGLPYTNTITQFSHDFLEWISTRENCSFYFDYHQQSSTLPGSVLQNVLPYVERLDVDDSANWEELFEQLGIQENKRDEFVVSSFATLNNQPWIKDYLFDSLELYSTLSPKNEQFSRTYNRIAMKSVFYHTEILRKYDFIAILNSPLAPERLMAPNERIEVCDCLKNTMALTARETDPATFMEPKSLKLFDLQRGISVAIFGMTVLRQLPFETYFGFTLFKNGLPAAYGGAWVFGKRARFGINIFEPYRGGESGIVMGEILHVYKQCFDIDFIEIEAYQFGQDNPDGIKSGAYWFYYKHGFRSIDKKLRQLAEEEKAKMNLKPGYRSNEKTLLRFTESNMALMLTPNTPTDVTELNILIRKNINKQFKGIRTSALQMAFSQIINRKPVILATHEQKHISAEWALLAQACGVFAMDENQIFLDRIEEIIEFRINDLYKYQKNLNSLIQDLIKK